MTALLVLVAFGVGVLVGMALARRQQPSAASAPVVPITPVVEAVQDVREAEDATADVAPVAPSPVPEHPAGDGLKDSETGLLNDRFFSVTLEARISAARRHLRPVAVVVLEVVEGVHDDSPRAAHAPTIAAAIEKTLREADTACRLTGDRFGLVLEDTPETGAVWTVERLRRNLAPENPGFTMWAGVACYPAHAFSAEEILDRAGSALEAAKEWRQDRIEVATAAE